MKLTFKDPLLFLLPLHDLNQIGIFGNKQIQSIKVTTHMYILNNVLKILIQKRKKLKFTSGLKIKQEHPSRNCLAMSNVLPRIMVIFAFRKNALKNAYDFFICFIIYDLLCVSTAPKVGNLWFDRV